jgi:hypothetical protein
MLFGVPGRDVLACLWGHCAVGRRMLFVGNATRVRPLPELQMESAVLELQVRRDDLCVLL